MKDMPAVLVAAANMLLRNETTRVFDKAGFHSLLATDGLSALQIVREQKPDLVLLESNLPDMNGVDVYHQIKADPALANCSVILLAEQTQVEVPADSPDGKQPDPHSPPHINALENSPDAVYRQNLLTNGFDYFSPAITDISGYSPAELTALTAEQAQEFIHPDDWDCCNQVIAQAIETPKKSHTLLYRFKHKDGGYRWLEDHFSVTRDAQGSAMFRIGNLRDITDRHTLEDAVRESEEHFANMFNASPEAISVNSLSNGRVIDVNPAFCSLFGGSRQQVIGQNMHNLNIWVDIQEPRWIVELVQANGEAKDIEIRFKTATGAIGTGLVSARRISLAGEPVLLVITRDITPRKHDEMKLQESESKFRKLFENMEEGFSLQEIITDENGRTIDFRFLEANRAYQKHTGLIPQAIIGKTMLEIMPLANPRQIEAYGQVALTGKPISFEYFSETFNRHLRVRAFCPQLGRFATIFEDITWLKQAEITLRQNQERLRSVLENSLDAAYKRNLKTNAYDYLSPVFSHIAGYTYKEMLDLPVNQFTDWIHPDDQAEIDRIMDLAQAGTTGLAYQVEYRFKHKDGNYRWFLDRFTFTKDSNGSPLALIGSVSDITERKLAQEALHLANEQLANIIESSGDVIAVLDPNFCYSVFNSAFHDEFKQIFGRDLKPGDSMLEALAHLPNDKAEAVHLWKRAFDGENFIITQQFGDTALERKWYELRFSPIRNSLGKISGAVHIVHDITERKRAEAVLQAAHDGLEQNVIDRTYDLQEANVALEKASHAKDEFLAIMSHELRTPLTGVIGLAQVLQMKIYGELNEKQMIAINNIEQSGQRLHKLIEAILNYSRLQSDKQNFNLGVIPMDTVCRYNLRKFEKQALARNQTLRYSISPATITVKTDENSLGKILNNLLSNAVKFTPEGGSIMLSILGMPEEQQVRISISDTGIGIHENDMQRLFQPFSQLDVSLSRKYEGAGMGLALVQLMAEQIGGKMEVESVFGQGSIFTLVLPWQP